MKVPFLLLFLLMLVALNGCSSSLPESYGIYANTDRGRLRLGSNQVAIRGILFSQIPGLNKPSGIECGSLTSFVVYLKNILPTSIRVSKLEFQGRESASGSPGGSHEPVNLWVPTQPIEIDIKPVEGHADMYIVAPRSPVSKGFYALYIGAFGGDIPFEAGEVYDIVVGNVKDFPSYEEVVRSREQSIRSTASELMNRMNQLFNTRDYTRLAEIYRPSGQILAGAELQEYIKGTEIWFNTAGKVLHSEVTQVAISEDGFTAHCSVKTTYEKVGEQSESVLLTRIGDNVFITALD